MKRRLSQAIAAFCILSVAAAVSLNAGFDKNHAETSNYHRFPPQIPLNAEEDPHSPTLQETDEDESYNPFSDKFRFHSLYENTPEVNYQSLAPELSVFVPEPDQIYFNIPLLTEDLIDNIEHKEKVEDEYSALISSANVFKKLKLYEGFTDYTSPAYRYNLVQDKNYCDEVDVLSLLKPENIFHQYNVIDTYFRPSVKNMLKNVSDTYYLSKARRRDKRSPQILKRNVSVFFGTDDNYDYLRSIGVTHTCITQSYSTLKGAVDIATKHNMVKYYEQRNLPKTCIDYDVFFPTSYRLSDKEECTRFFQILNSREYATAKETTPVQYIMKVGAGTHQGLGVEVLSEELEEKIVNKYESGSLCGKIKDDTIAQKYIANPLLIYDNQKFDFRIYVLVASTNPLIAYYRDGFVRVSLQKYDSHTSEKKSHLTNSHLSDELVNHAKTKAEKEKLLNMQLSTFQMLADDLESKGRIHGEEGKKEFIEHLRQKFKTAIAHILRFVQPAFESRSGNYRLMGFDFMLDEDMNLWFIEANNSPQMTQTEAHRRYFTEILIRDAIEIEFALLRSRMKRVRRFVQKAAHEYLLKGEDWDEAGLRRLFKEANKEGFEPEFEVSHTNSWEKIIDLSQGSSEESGYLGNLDRSCFKHN